MLGRLRMTIQECIETYHTLSKAVFDESGLHQFVNFAAEGHRFSIEKLEEAIKAVVQDPRRRHGRHMKDLGGHICRTYVSILRNSSKLLVT